MPPKLPDDERKRRVNERVRKRRERAALPKFSTPTPPAGRPRAYDGAAHCARAKRLALLGLTDNEIAFQFGINADTLNAWKTDYPEFSDSLNEGKTEADGFVAESHYNRAIGFQRPAVKIFMPPNSVDDDGNPKPVYAPFMEYYPGDVGAQKSWLNNRQPDRWRDRRPIEGTLTVEHRIAQMTDEERMTQLRELTLRAQAMITDATVVDDEDTTDG